MTTDYLTSPFDQPSAARAASPDPEGGNGAYSFDGKPDRWKRYRLPHPDTGKADGFTRMTTFAKSCSDTYTLSQWSQRMVMIGLTQRHDLYTAVAATSPDDREKLNNLAEDAKNAAGAKVGANLGTALHAFSEMLDRGETPHIPPPYQPHMAAYTALLEEYGLEVLDIERVVLCTSYDEKGVAGTLDRVVRFTRDVTVQVGSVTHTFKKGTVAILDLKTGKTMEYGQMEIAIQLSGYANAEHRWDKEALRWLPQFEGMDRDVALVLHLPATAPGETVEAAMYAVDIKGGREIANLCTEVRKARKRKGLMTKLSVVREEPISAVVGTDGQGYVNLGFAEGQPLINRSAITTPSEPTLYDRVREARTRADLTAVWFDAMKQRKDTPELSAAISSRMSLILADTAGG
jgi:hypothetical protein